MKHEDEIIAEVRAAREAYAARFNYDLNLICQDLKAKEQEHPDRLAQLEPAEPKFRHMVHLTAELRQALKDCAARQGWSVDELIHDAVVQYLVRNEAFFPGVKRGEDELKGGESTPLSSKMASQHDR